MTFERQCQVTKEIDSDTCSCFGNSIKLNKREMCGLLSRGSGLLKKLVSVSCEEKHRNYFSKA
jgi:hypothetical protein